VFDICFLGTMSAVPTRERALTSTLIVHGQRRFLVDCGEGVQQRLLQSGRGFAGLTRVFLTHAHLDHYIGLASLLFTLDTLNAVVQVEVFAEAQTLQLVDRLLSLWEPRDSITVTRREIRDGVLLEDDELRISAVSLAHTVPSYAFVF